MNKKKIYNIDFFKKLFFIFLIGSIFGLLVEETYLYFRGVIFDLDRLNWNFNRSLLYGPFSPVYGFGAVVLTICFGDKKIHWFKIFILSTLLGGVTEYIASFLQENIFGYVSWEYTNKILNIHGRTTIPYMLGFGLVGVVFIKGIYPYLTNFLDKIKPKTYNVLFYTLFIFMLFNTITSCLAFNRYYERKDNIVAENKIDDFYDKFYPDDLIYKHVFKLKRK